jgi:hypothetical protein
VIHWGLAGAELYAAFLVESLAASLAQVTLLRSLQEWQSEEDSETPRIKLPKMAM